MNLLVVLSLFDPNLSLFFAPVTVTPTTELREAVEAPGEIGGSADVTLVGSSTILPQSRSRQVKAHRRQPLVDPEIHEHDAALHGENFNQRSRCLMKSAKDSGHYHPSPHGGKYRGRSGSLKFETPQRSKAAKPADANAPRHIRALVAGIGPINALTALAEAGDFRRFRHHRQLLKLCGMDLAHAGVARKTVQPMAAKYVRNGGVRYPDVAASASCDGLT